MFERNITWLAAIAVNIVPAKGIGFTGWVSCGRKQVLRVNVSKNRRKFQKCGHGQKIDFAHTLQV